MNNTGNEEHNNSGSDYKSDNGIATDNNENDNTGTGSKNIIGLDGREDIERVTDRNNVDTNINENCGDTT